MSPHGSVFSTQKGCYAQSVPCWPCSMTHGHSNLITTFQLKIDNMQGPEALRPLVALQATRPWEHRPAPQLNPPKWDGAEHLSINRIGLETHLVPNDSDVSVYEFTTGSTTQTVYLDELLSL